MEFVYLLWHTHVNERLSGGEDIKLIGIYTSYENANAALLRTEKLEDFRNFSEGFEISQNMLDKDEWSSGFVIVSEDEE